jgi:hypothetical protein
MSCLVRILCHDDALGATAKLTCRVFIFSFSYSSTYLSSYCHLIFLSLSVPILHEIHLIMWLCNFRRYALDAAIVRYAKVALSLPNKTVRDVALRCRWMSVSCMLSPLCFFNLLNFFLLRTFIVPPTYL